MPFFASTVPQGNPKQRLTVERKQSLMNGKRLNKRLRKDAKQGKVRPLSGQSSPLTVSERVHFDGATSCRNNPKQTTGYERAATAGTWSRKTRFNARSVAVLCR